MSSRSKWDVLVGSDLQRHEDKVVNFSSMDPPPTVSAGLREETQMIYNTQASQSKLQLLASESWDLSCPWSNC